ncbi:MAG: hypothetical protein AAF629_02185 [Chloroflexota bacterium]
MGKLQRKDDGFILLSNWFSMEQIGLLISLLLTLMVFSYVFGDNPLFKVAEHIFVGVSVAYALLVAWYLVLYPYFFQELMTAEGQFQSEKYLLKVPPALLSLLLFFKMGFGHLPRFKSIAGFGSITLAFLIGLGAALAIEGALFGTLLPQVTATIGLELRPSDAYAGAPYGLYYLHNDFLSNVVVLLGTVGTLFYFTFTYRPTGLLSGFREGFVNFWAGIGRLIILITLGALFTNTISARFALLLSRISFLVDGFQQLFG